MPRKDRTKTAVVGMTGLGLIEMTRKKVKQELSTVLNVVCPYCDGSGKVLSPEGIARNIAKEITRYMSQTTANTLQVELHPAVERVLKSDINGYFSRLQETYNRKILFKGSEKLRYDEIRINQVDIRTLVC